MINIILCIPLTLSGWVFSANLRNAFSITLLSGSEGGWSVTLSSLQYSLNLWSFSKFAIFYFLHQMQLCILPFLSVCRFHLKMLQFCWEGWAMIIKTETWPRAAELLRASSGRLQECKGQGALTLSPSLVSILYVSTISSQKAHVHSFARSGSQTK